MTREQIVAELNQEYAKRRDENLLAFEAKTADACAKCKGLAELLQARHQAVIGGVRATLLAKNKEPGSASGLGNAMSRYNRQIADVLTAGGLPTDYLQPIYTCSVCKDEGYVYDPSRRMCDCMAQELNRRLMRESGLEGDRQTFENFDETLFSDESGENGTSQRKLAISNRNLCLRYADSFPNTETRDLLLMGKSGLGKTFLLKAIAHRTAERGYLPVYTSAYHMFEVARQAYFENNSALLGELMTAQLLLVDDLGTEPLMNNITITQLFNLLNERQLAGRHTAISTNLSLSELQERYTERVTSRFLDVSSCTRITFIGNDIRENLKRG